MLLQSNRISDETKEKMMERVLIAVVEELQRRGYRASIVNNGKDYRQWGVDTDAPDELRDEIVSEAFKNYNKGKSIKNNDDEQDGTKNEPHPARSQETIT